MKTKTTEVTGTLSYVERRPSSRNGNPRFAIYIDTKGLGCVTGVHLTRVDASVGYEITNYKLGRRVTLTLSGKREAVIGMRYADEVDS